MIAAMYCTEGFAPRETESNQTSQQLNPPDSAPVTDEELGTMRLNELCALWMEGRL
ncbi:MAG: hypothetical protein WA637_18705 [Terriglobales bacterium]